MVTNKISAEDIRCLANGVLKVALPDYKACRCAMSLVGYVRDTWPKDDESMPRLSSEIDKETNVITITCDR